MVKKTFLTFEGTDVQRRLTHAWKGAIRVDQFASMSDQYFLNYFA